MFTLGRYPVHIEKKKGSNHNINQKEYNRNLHGKHDKRKNSRLDRKREKKNEIKRKKRKSETVRLELATGEFKLRRSNCHTTTAVATAFCV